MADPTLTWNTGDKVPYIRKGDSIIADDGSVTCIAIRDIYAHDTLSPDAFEWIGRPKPISGEIARSEDGFKSTPYGTVLANIRRADEQPAPPRIDKLPRF
jgi:hypothetical protein